MWWVRAAINRSVAEDTEGMIDLATDDYLLMPYPLSRCAKCNFNFDNN